ncbi:MAG: helicase-associated domain-containing protein, partial [Chitinispirillia bacterium]
MHTYVITPLSLWNAASLGWKPDLVIESLKKYSKYPIPANIVQDIIELMGRFGKLILKKKDDNLLIIQSKDKNLVKQFSLHPKLSSLFGKYISDNEIEVLPKYRGHIKKIFISLGYPVHDLAGYVDGEKFDMRLRDVCLDGNPFYLREYQSLASDSFMGTSSMPGGSGVVLLPCGAGKTIVGLSVLARLKRKSLILVTNITAAHQWKREILNRMVIQEEDIGEYSGESKEIKPITIATYQILTYRKRKIDPFIHFDIFNKENWGIIIYDEVHLLPAPVFKFTAEIQARRRLGLTATLIREDGHEKDVFTLIGPKKYDVPWKVLEKQGWIAS